MVEVLRPAKLINHIDGTVKDIKALKIVAESEVLPTDERIEEESKQNISEEELKIKLLECYEKLNYLISRYIDIPINYAKIINIWIIGTYIHSQLNTYPFLFLNATKGSGKTRTLKYISSLSHGGDGSVLNSVSEAVIFRIPAHTTTCIDELESIQSKEKNTLRELFNACYKKGIKVKRMKKKKTPEGEDYVVESYEPFFPLAMANINGLDEVLADRAISLVLEKSNNPTLTKKIEDFTTNPKFLDIKSSLNSILVQLCSVVTSKSDISKWNDYIDFKETINYTTTYNTIHTYNYTTTLTKQPNLTDKELTFFNKIDESNIFGRNFELFFPLFLVAREISDECFEDILKISKEMVKERKDEDYVESKEVNLFEFVSQLEPYKSDWINIKTLTERYATFIQETPEKSWWLNPKWMGKALKRLGLVKIKKRISDGIMVMLDVEKAKEKLLIYKP